MRTETEPCECCEEQDAIARITITDLEGSVDDSITLCSACLKDIRKQAGI